ncbi:MAG: SDR family NAD(P)-dependent oxidoreductase [bacterium]|nr:SDR family NAD(P)-dependent oxidoreductase [bacterium]
MKVVVTGGAGFIGRHVADKLIEAGHEVTIVDNLSRSFPEGINPKAKFVEADIADSEKMSAVLSGQEAVIHLANYIVVPESVERAVEYTENNIVKTVKLLEVMRQARVTKIIFSSSATVYGEIKNLPIKETDPIGLSTNPYGATKVAMEQMIAAYHHNWGFEATLLRYFNPYGPGENHEPETHAIPNFVVKTIKNEPIPLYWKGEQVRDFIYVEDLAVAHVRALELEGMNTLNVGTGSGEKVIDLVKQIFSLVGHSVPITDLGPRAGDAQETYASVEMIKKVLGWEAQTSLVEGLQKTIDHFQKKLNAEPSS